MDWSSALSSSSRRHHPSTENTLVELPVSLSRTRNENRTNTLDVPIEPLTSEPLARSETPLPQLEIDTPNMSESCEKTTEQQSCALEVSAPCGPSIQFVDRSNVFIFKPIKIIT